MMSLLLLLLLTIIIIIIIIINNYYYYFLDHNNNRLQPSLLYLSSSFHRCGWLYCFLRSTIAQKIPISNDVFRNHMCIYCICTAMALQWLISMILFCLEIVLDGTLVLFSNFL